MLTPPPGVTEADIADLLGAEFGITATGIEHLAVGFGSHNYRVTGNDGARWFAKVEREPGPEKIAEVRAAYAAAEDLRQRCGLDFLVTPLGPVRQISGRGFALFPFVAGAPAGPGTHYPDPGDLAAVAEMVGRMHTCRPSRHARRETFLTPRRQALLAVLDAPGGWDGGPFGQRARERVDHSAERIRRLFDRYDELAGAADPDGWVMTHGEPHSGNVIKDGAGALHLVDLDTVLLAPRERDLLHLGVPVPGAIARPELLELYRLRWDLGEIAEYAIHFHGPHDGSPDDEIRWRELAAYLAG